MTDTAFFPPADTPPRHGDRGDTVTPVPPSRPRGLTVAVTREAGARGRAVAARAAELLGWQAFDQESLDHIAQEEDARREVLRDLPAGAAAWADAALAALARRGRLPADGAADMARVLFALAARGEVVLVGRGAGFVLPAATTLHVRVVSPRAVRSAYLADGLRLTPDEADAELDARDRARLAFLAQMTSRDPLDAGGYDLVLNSARLGVEAAAAVVAAAVRTRHLDEPDPVAADPT